MKLPVGKFWDAVRQTTTLGTRCNYLLLQFRRREREVLLRDTDATQRLFPPRNTKILYVIVARVRFRP